MRPVVLRALIAFLAVALGMQTRAALGQGAISGVVREDSTGRPLAGAEVQVEALDRRTTTDEAGRYVLRNLPAGVRLLRVRFVGYEPVSMMVEVALGETRTQDITLERSAVRLDSIVVKEEPRRPDGLRESFEDRRRMGFGKFIDSTELRRNEHRHLHDMLRSIPGVVVASPPLCGRGQVRNCVTSRFTRVAVGGRTKRLGTLLGSASPCFMEVYLNGVLLARGGEREWDKAFDLNDIDVAQLDAIEVYRSTAEIPAEFIGTSAQCGVIVLWARWGRTP